MPFQLPPNYYGGLPAHQQQPPPPPPAAVTSGLGCGSLQPYYQMPYQQHQHHYHNQQQQQRLLPPPQQPQQHQQNYIHHQPNHPRVVETKYMLKKQGPMGSSLQANAAASFFAKAHQRLNNNNEFASTTSGGGASPRLVLNNNMMTSDSYYGGEGADDQDATTEPFATNFRAVVHRSPPQIPTHLLRRLEVTTALDLAVGKIRVILRVAKGSSLAIQSPDGGDDIVGNQIFQMDRRRKQLTMYDPTVIRGSSSGGGGANNQADNFVSLEERKVGVAAPKMFAFDNVFTDQDPQEDVAGSALSDIIASVVNGTDGCLFCFGHANLGKSRSMLGSDESSKSLGIVPITIAWLYRAIKEKKTRTGARFSIRVSALEVTSQRENLRDLLEPYSSENDQSPGVYLRNLPINRVSSSSANSRTSSSAGDVLANQSELRASSAEKAAYYLDAALAARSADTRGRESHLLFTLHVYQYSVQGVGPTGVSGGRSRLHLLDFGGCERTKTPGGGITLSGLGNVILGIFNGQKHLPHRDSKVTQLLRECLGSLTCQATMLAHVSPEPSHYSETLHTVQLASRLHRMRRKRLKNSSSSRGLRSSSSGRSSRSGSGSSSGLTTSTNASSSEQSCDTVVYRGGGGSGYSDISGSDGEHPPILRGRLHGSLDDIPRPASSASSSHSRRRRKILTNGAISPRQCLSPQPGLTPSRSPASGSGATTARSSSSLSGRLNGLPSIPEVVNSGKMPLSGLVPVQSSHHRLRQLQQQAAAAERSSPIRQEIWIDKAPLPTPPPTGGPPSSMNPSGAAPTPATSRPTPYGFMDEHKANMIHTWVEKQSTNENNSVFLTQFKQVAEEDSDENNISAVDAHSAQHKAIIHHQQQQNDQEDLVVVHEVTTKVVKPKPPPPPPRRTPPRETTIVPMIDDETAPATTEIIEDTTIQDEAISGHNITKDQNTTLASTEGGGLVSTSEMSCQVSEQELKNNFLPEEPGHHPLRILSEENLSIVSSFAGSRDKLDVDNDDELRNDEIDPSKLSFFQVPDFNPSVVHEETIAQTFKDFETMHNNYKPPSPLEQFQDPRYANLFKDEHHHHQLHPHFPQQQQNQKKNLTTFNSNFYSSISNNTSSYSNKCEMITPQKQFLLLSQSLRHPDGSSNPELNVAVQQGEKVVETTVIAAGAASDEKRSPGNGKSDSEQDFAVDNANIVDNSVITSPSGNNNSIIENNSITDAPTLNPNPNNQPMSFTNHHHHHSIKEQNQQQQQPKKSKFGFKFLRLFGSQRAKSCDSRKVQKLKNSEQQQQNIKSASSSPMIKKSDPSTLSISTEWEFEPQDDDDNGNSSIDKEPSPPHHPMLFEHLMIPKIATTKDRKSSGYDSLGGDESSSLDSNESKPTRKMLNSTNNSINNIRLSKEVNNSLAKAFRPAASHLVHPAAAEVQPQYALPNDYFGQINIMQYDELDIQRMEQRYNKQAK